MSGKEIRPVQYDVRRLSRTSRRTPVASGVPAKLRSRWSALLLFLLAACTGCGSTSWTPSNPLTIPPGQTEAVSADWPSAVIR